MFAGLRKQWASFRKDPPGSRFRLRYERRRHHRRGPMVRIAWSIIGATVVVIGMVLMPAPGPGIPVVLLGGAILAEESLYVARALDWCELRLRGRPRGRGSAPRRQSRE